MTTYLDTSAAMKLLVEEPESEALAAHLDALDDELVASLLLFTELHCAGHRRAELDPASINAVLDAVDLVDLTRADLVVAATSAWGLRTADAIHLATALRVEADTLATYDAEMADAALRAGLSVSAPGA